MNQHLTQIAEALDSAETIGNIVRTNTIDGGHVLVEFSPTAFGGYENAEAAAKLFKASPKLLEVARLVLSAAQNRSDHDYRLMHIDLGEAAEIARAAIREAAE